MYTTGCPTKHDSKRIVLNVFFLNNNKLFDTKQNNKKYFIAYYDKKKFQSKIYLSKDFVTEINCKKSVISYKVHGRRHSKLFTNCHVSWDTLYLLNNIKYNIVEMSSSYFTVYRSNCIM